LACTTSDEAPSIQTRSSVTHLKLSPREDFEWRPNVGPPQLRSRLPVSLAAETVVVGVQAIAVVTILDVVDDAGQSYRF
jgi:hypothetical protein